MPLRYFMAFMKKTPNLSWEECHRITNEEFLGLQLAEIAKHEADKQKEIDRINHEKEEKAEEKCLLLEKQKKEAVLRKQQEEDKCKKQEAAAKLLQIKQEKDQGHQMFKTFLPGLVEVGTSSATNSTPLNGVKVKQEKFDAQENPPVPSTAVCEKQEDTPFGTLPHKKDSVDDKLAHIGELIIDEDVFLALNHLKEVGVAIHQGKA